MVPTGKTSQGSSADCNGIKKDIDHEALPERDSLLMGRHGGVNASQKTHESFFPNRRGFVHFPRDQLVIEFNHLLYMLNQTRYAVSEEEFDR